MTTGNSKNYQSYSKWIALSCFIGLILSFYALYVEIRIEIENDYQAMCDISEKISCTKVVSSKYGRGFGFLGDIFGEDSILNQRNPNVGISAYILIAVLGYIDNIHAAKTLLFICILSNLMSIYLAYLLFVIDSLCVICVSTHPHHRSDEDGVDMDLATNFQKAWKQRMVSGQQQSLSSQQQQSYLRNQISRHSERLTQRSPIATNVLSMTKDNLMNFPLNLAMQALTEVCHTAIITETLNPTYAPELNEIQVHLMTESENISVPLDQAEELMKSASSGLDFDNKKTVVYITSWKSNTNNQNDPLNVLRRAFQCRGTENLLVVDIGNFVDNYHALQTLNTEIVGQWIGDVLSQLKDNVQSSKLHLVGHGIGAHIAGVAGRKYRQNTGNLLPRITGLDPAMLCYKNYENVVELHKGDAQFVDIIHSNSYGLGNPVPMGDVDFYPNYRRTNTPGCDNVMCAHEMAVRYFAESVLPGYENNFIGMMKTINNNQNSQTQSSYYGGKYSSFVPRNRQNIEQMYDEDSKQEQQVPMGYSTPVNTKGIYYLNTNSQYPYGKNVQSGSAPQCVRGQSVSPVY